MRRTLAAGLCVLSITGLMACGGTAATSVPSSSDATSSSTPAPTKQLTTLPDGLHGSCTGDPLLLNNKLGSVDLKTENGQLEISIPSAADLTLVDIGYFVNIYSADDEWTQVRMNYFNSTGEKNLYITKLYGDSKTTKIGTFDVDHSNENMLNVSVPTSLITGDTDVTWNAAFDENGKDVAFCPAKQEDKANLDPA